MYLAGVYNGFLYLVNLEGGVYRYDASSNAFTNIGALGNRLNINCYTYTMIDNLIYYMTQVQDNYDVTYNLYSFDVVTNQTTLKNTIYGGVSSSSSQYYQYYSLFQYNGSLFSFKYRGDGSMSGTPVAVLGSGSISAIPTTYGVMKAIVYKGMLYALVRNSATIYAYNGRGWISITEPLISCEKDIVVFNNELHYFGVQSARNGWLEHYKYDGSSWTQLSQVTQSLNTSYAHDIVTASLNNSLYIYIGDNSSSIPSYTTNNHMYEYTLSYFTFDNYTVILQRGETGIGAYQTAFANLTKSIQGTNRFISGFDDCFYFTTNGFENVPMYYGNGSQWIKFKN